MVLIRQDGRRDRIFQKERGNRVIIPIKSPRLAGTT